MAVGINIYLCIMQNNIKHMNTRRTDGVFGGKNVHTNKITIHYLALGNHKQKGNKESQKSKAS